jgi:putative membrane protein
MRRLAALAAVTGLLLIPGTAAQAAPSDQDAAYLKAAHQSNLAEIAGGKIAQQKGDSAVRQTASNLGVDLPSAPNAEQQALAARYQAASGDDFDALFVSTQMDAHMKAMALGRTEIADGSDAAAKKVAQNAAPVIMSHHEALDSAAKDLGIPSTVNTGTGGTADDGGISGTAVGFVALGMLLVVAAGLLLRRRTVRA